MGTFITALILVLIVGLAIRAMIKKKQAGIGSCGGSCSNCQRGCPMAGSVLKENKKE